MALVAKNEAGEVVKAGAEVRSLDGELFQFVRVNDAKTVRASNGWTMPRTYPASWFGLTIEDDAVKPIPPAPIPEPKKEGA